MQDIIPDDLNLINIIHAYLWHPPAPVNTLGLPGMNLDYATWLTCLLISLAPLLSIFVNFRQLFLRLWERSGVRLSTSSTSSGRSVTFLQRTSAERGPGSKSTCRILNSHKQLLLGWDMTKCSKWLHTDSNHVFFWVWQHFANILRSWWGYQEDARYIFVYDWHKITLILTNLARGIARTSSMRLGGV